MSYIHPQSRQQFSLPVTLDEYVSSDNIVRFIDVFVDKTVKKSEITYNKGWSDIGRSAYPFSVLLKIYIYGYLNSISSSRKLENECCRNMEMIWLTGNLHPDHKTISDFRKDNKEGIRAFTLQFRAFLRDEKYISGKTVVTDGTKVKAYAGKNTLSLDTINQRIERTESEIDKYLNQLNENDLSENFDEHLTGLSEDLGVETALLEKIAGLQNKVDELEAQKRFLEQNGRESLAPADPGAKTMKTRQGFMPAYNVQSTVDTENHMIAQFDVTDHPNDFHDLQPNVDAVKEQLGIVPEEVLADGGYNNEEQIQALESRHIKCIVPFPENYQQEKDIENGISFEYDKKNDYYICPQGRQLNLTGKKVKKRNHLYNKYQAKNCAGCPLKSKCTKSKTGRILYKRIDSKWLEGYKQRLKTSEYKQGIKDRKKYVEHPFGTIKYWMGQIPLLLRGKEKVQVEIDLYSTCYNLRRLLNIENTQSALQKVQNWE
jgi:transposase